MLFQTSQIWVVIQLLKKGFLSLYTLCSLGLETGNWVLNVKSIFQKHDMLHCFNMENVSKVEIDDCLDLLKSFRCKCFEIQCIQDVNQKPILRTYCLYKTEFDLEPYLKCVLKYKLRSAISRFRLSSHNLEIKKGHHSKPKTLLEQRLCLLCNMGDVEDEVHVLLVCPIYNEER